MLTDDEILYARNQIAKWLRRKFSSMQDDATSVANVAVAEALKQFDSSRSELTVRNVVSLARWRAIDQLRCEGTYSQRQRNGLLPLYFVDPVESLLPQLPDKRQREWDEIEARDFMENSNLSIEILTLLRWRFVEGLTLREIAKRLGVSQTSALFFVRAAVGEARGGGRRLSVMPSVWKAFHNGERLPFVEGMVHEMVRRRRSCAEIRRTTRLELVT